MERNKVTIGFETSATKMQSELDNLHKILGTKKIEWANLSQLGTKQMTQTMKDTETQIRKSKPNADTLILESGFAQYWSILALLGKLGTEILEVHERLAGVEKAIKELKLVIK